MVLWYHVDLYGILEYQVYISKGVKLGLVSSVGLVSYINHTAISFNNLYQWVSIILELTVSVIIIEI